MRSALLIVAFGQSILGAFSPAHISIMQIQGRGHVSSYSGDTVVTTGVVTVVSQRGFFVQDPLGDGDPSTSDGLFVFTGSRPAVNVGDRVRLDGVVQEYRPGAYRHNLSVTEMARPQIETLFEGCSIPHPVIVGRDGRLPPTETIDDDSLGRFDPAFDGIDFYESLEGMLVRVSGAVAVSATNRFGEVWVLADGRESATGVNAHGGITISRDDMNPERIQVDDALLERSLSVGVGDHIGDVTGVVSYGYGNFEILPQWIPAPTRGRMKKEVTSLSADDTHLSVVSFNVHNLSRDEPERIAALADIITTNLRAPDILALQEIQDDSGSIDDGTVEARLTYTAVIDAIRAAGGPEYDFREVAPGNGQDGGAPGGNIRVGFLFRRERVTFVDRGNATSSFATSVVESDEGPMLSISPGRIDPLNDAWRSTRKPLAAEFVFLDRTFFVVACHFSSRIGSTPLFGATQPPVIGGRSRRIAQARVVLAFVERLLVADSLSSVIVLGDFNDFQFSESLAVLTRDLLNLTNDLPQSERYTYNFEGNSQALDHILVSPAFADGAQYDVVHVSAEFADGVSDHDPVLVRLAFSTAPSAQGAPSRPVASPNPFSTTTSLSYITTRPGPVEVTIYDVSGRRVRTLKRRHESAGTHGVRWDGRDDRGRGAPTGVYFVRLMASGRSRVTKVILIR